ncbi:hypothetical protein EMIHUDRAFT_224729 [Emiliania huxleyi CCMP1516]|uniref:Uncharacterized protein n=2 Tax=Emiliania huxleyi TaxID=2903 RepID=A0A0D3KRF3_EMIH1|nr:hypothetical protein EMIHUDRAFT_224729 [Emiliania huxleyi CCMP1516]EOD38338.1 hypothetical protein EMIHUDRAFT_224729 [Emiliania huxleyi CCMP1516]|eukprot:XP_005790767.1 hypothetical protein EMIHUDRAFT_224729 [Emiliania huxleyi CCMP1516]
MRPVEISGVGYMGNELVTTGLSAGGGVRAATGLYFSVIKRLRRACTVLCEGRNSSSSVYTL